jgi:Kdo2-lipid IVA lauroyltransferase/acyltransferase
MMWGLIVMLNVHPPFLRLVAQRSDVMKSPFVESIEYHSFVLLSKISRALSFRTAAKVGSFLGATAFRTVGYRKSITLDNLRHAFPELPESGIRDIALRSFRNYGRMLVEMLWSLGQEERLLKDIVRLRNPEVLQKASAGASGIIILSAHFGSWEFLLSSFRLQVGRPFVSIVQHQRNKRIDDMINTMRTRWDNITIPMGVSTREAFRALREGNVLLMLGDQSGPKEAVFIDFFGRPAATHRGAAAFSLKIGAPIVMALLVRREDGTYEGVFEEVDKSGLEAYTEENVIELTRRHVAVLEGYIRQYPDHWLWMHKRWKHTGLYQAAIPEEAEVHS